MRLIHLTSSGGWGGREMYPAALAEAQTRKGHRVSLVSKRGTPLSRYLAASGLDHDTLRIGPYLDPAAAWHLSRIIRARRPEIIQVHFSRDLALVDLACAFARQRPALILHKHITSGSNKRDPLHRRLYGRLAAVVAVSDFVKRSVVASCPIEEGRVRVIFNGVDSGKFGAPSGADDPGRKALRAELGAEDEGLVLAAVVGRIEPRKGQAVFLEAATRLAGKVPELRYAVVGAPEGGFDRELRALAENPGLAGKVIISGHRGDAVGLFRALDILVVPSFEEAFGLVAVEGMLCGLPVVAAHAGALPEFIENGRTGLLVSCRDPQALAEALERLARDPGLRSELGGRGHVWAMENLSLERSLDSLESLYRDCLAGW